MSISNVKIQLLAHASFKVTTPEGRTLLVDPWFTNNPFMPEQLGWPDEVDLILITHGHDDHLDTRIIDVIRRKQPKVIANPLVRWYLIEQGVPAHTFIGMNIGGTVSLMDMKVTMTAGFHMAHIDLGNGRVGFPHLSVGFVLSFSEDTNVYFSGDTGVFSDMQLIGRLYKPDIAVLPIGNRFTMGPEEAAEAIRLLNVKQVIPCHYGTMAALTGTPEELERLTTDIEGLQIHVLKAGELYEG